MGAGRGLRRAGGVDCLPGPPGSPGVWRFRPAGKGRSFVASAAPMSLRATLDCRRSTAGVLPAGRPGWGGGAGWVVACGFPAGCGLVLLVWASGGSGLPPVRRPGLGGTPASPPGADWFFRCGRHGVTGCRQSGGLAGWVISPRHRVRASSSSAGVRGRACRVAGGWDWGASAFAAGCRLVQRSSAASVRGPGARRFECAASRPPMRTSAPPFLHYRKASPPGTDARF